MKTQAILILDQGHKLGKWSSNDLTSAPSATMHFGIFPTSLTAFSSSFRNKKATSTSNPNSGAEKSGHSHGDGDTSFMAEMEEGCDETMRHERPRVAAEGSHAAIFTPLQEVSDGEAPPWLAEYDLIL